MVPIVFAMGSDPVSTGLVGSFNRPGGNVTGVASLTSTMEPKRLGLLRELVPSVALVGALVNPNFPNFRSQSLALCFPHSWRLASHSASGVGSAGGQASPNGTLQSAGKGNMLSSQSCPTPNGGRRVCVLPKPTKCALHSKEGPR
jgi:hypothetical protein